MIFFTNGGSENKSRWYREPHLGHLQQVITFATQQFGGTGRFTRLLRVAEKHRPTQGLNRCVSRKLRQCLFRFHITNVIPWLLKADLRMIFNKKRLFAGDTNFALTAKFFSPASGFEWLTHKANQILKYPVSPER